MGDKEHTQGDVHKRKHYSPRGGNSTSRIERKQHRESSSSPHYMTPTHHAGWLD